MFLKNNLNKLFFYITTVLSFFTGSWYMLYKFSYIEGFLNNMAVLSASFILAIAICLSANGIAYLLKTDQPKTFAMVGSSIAIVVLMLGITSPATLIHNEMLNNMNTIQASYLKEKAKLLKSSNKDFQATLTQTQEQQYLEDINSYLNLLDITKQNSFNYYKSIQDSEIKARNAMHYLGKEYFAAKKHLIHNVYSSLPNEYTPLLVVFTPLDNKFLYPATTTWYYQNSQNLLYIGWLGILYFAIVLLTLPAKTAYYELKHKAQA